MRSCIAKDGEYCEDHQNLVIYDCITNCFSLVKVLFIMFSNSKFLTIFKKVLV